MMTIKRFTCNMLAENCYVVSDEARAAVIIDYGALYEEEAEAIVSYIKSEGLTPVHLLCTHGHFDHCIGNGFIYKQFGLKPEAHHEDEFLMEKMKVQTREMLGIELPIDVPPVGKYFTEKETISFGSHQLQILHTPGHTPGGVVFYCQEENIAFSGDTLFKMSIGRTDFERGSYEQIINSLQNVLAKLPEETKVYPGHGPATTIAEELLYNPYFRRL